MSVEYKLTQGATVVVAPLTYLNKQRYLTLVRLAINNMDSVMGKLRLDIALDKDAVLPILIDLIRVSAHVTTDHPITEWLIDYTADLDTLANGFIDFLGALENPEMSNAFEELVKAVTDYEKGSEHKHPVKPIDPN